MLDIMKVKNRLLPLFTDLSKFNPIADKDGKQKLRIKYGIKNEAFVVSHMGHLNEGRNLRSLTKLQNEGCQIVVVASSSTPIDSKGPNSIKQELEENGIVIIDRYIENIQEIYQLSDCYIFPVIEPNSSIGLPLSILEARACGIPVITTDYGSVRQYLDNDFDGIFYSTPEAFVDTICLIKESGLQSFQQTKVNGLNEIFIKSINNVIES